MLQINQISCSLDESLSKDHIAKKLRCPIDDIQEFEILKESLDARKGSISLIYSVLAVVVNENRYLFHKHVSLGVRKEHQSPLLKSPLSYRPIIVGFGPTGLFAALTLAKAGCKPIILERGKDVDNRVLDVQEFWNTGNLNVESNVQFGEGGAGTFSDGKLTTRIKDTRVFAVLDALIEAGADPSIRYLAHPHIGTDKLRNIVKNIRLEIIRLGGEIHFNTRLDSFEKKEDDYLLYTSNEIFKTKSVFLCLGHSAKDTLATLHKNKLFIEAKNFAVGVRIEHKQQFINQCQYKQFNNHPRLGAAEYRLTHTASNGRGVYTFCMCPGGFVVPSSSNKNCVVVNGMSESQRNQENANSAILVQIPTTDFYQSSPLDGFKFQEELEEKAFILGGSSYQAPCQKVEDYLAKKVSYSSTLNSSYALGVHFTDLHSLFSDEVNQALHEGILAFDRKMPGFAKNALLTGVESRSSCPIRIPRDTSLESLSHPNIYPCGEGAGYAGGIVSSAVDGIRCAEQLIHKLNLTSSK